MIVNCTPHELSLYPADTARYNFVSKKLEFPPDDPCPLPSMIVLPQERPARCKVIQRVLHDLLFDDFSLPVIQASYGPVYDMPDPFPGTLYVVSYPVAEALQAQGRTRDVRVPYNLVYYRGRVVGCTALSVLPKFLSK